jgi:multiple sugar transport system substrate-binding protein
MLVDYTGIIKKRGKGIMFQKGKKMLAIATMAAVIAGMAAGCGSSSQTDSKASSNGPVKLVYAKGKEAGDGTRQLVDAFNKKHAGKIEVQYVELPADSDKQHDQYVTVFGAGGTDYDVVDVDTVWPSEFAQAGYALPIDKYIAKDNINLKDYMEGPMRSVTFKGKVWGLPKYIDAGMMFYRKDLMEKAPETWEDVVAQGEQLKDKIDFSYVGQFKQYEGLICNSIEFIAAYGGQIVDGDGNITISSEGTKKGLEMMKKIVGSDFVPNNITTFAEQETHNAFIEGKAAIIRNWPYVYGMSNDPKQSKIVGKVGIAPLPKGSVRSAACLGGWSAIINKNSKHPDEAWEFLKFMCGPEGQKMNALSVSGSVAPTLLSLYKDPEIGKVTLLFADPNFVNALSVTVPRPVSPVYTKLSNIMQVEISNYLAGRQDVDTAIKNMDAKMKEAVASS